MSVSAKKTPVIISQWKMKLTSCQNLQIATLIFKDGFHLITVIRRQIFFLVTEVDNTCWSSLFFSQVYCFLSFFKIICSVLQVLHFTFYICNSQIRIKVPYWETKNWEKKTQKAVLMPLLDQYQYLGNCPPTPPLTQQQSIDNKLGLMLG